MFSLFFHFSYFLIFSHLINYFSFLFNRGFTVYFVLYYDPNLLILFCFVLFGFLYMLTSICRSENRVQTAACWLFLLHSTFWFFNLISHYKLFYFFIWLLIACMLCSDLYFILIFFVWVFIRLRRHRFEEMTFAFCVFHLYCWVFVFFSVFLLRFSHGVSSFFFYFYFLLFFDFFLFILFYCVSSSLLISTLDLFSSFLCSLFRNNVYFQIFL